MYALIINKMEYLITNQLKNKTKKLMKIIHKPNAVDFILRKLLVEPQEHGGRLVKVDRVPARHRELVM